jgi:hypothetical protein
MEAFIGFSLISAESEIHFVNLIRRKCEKVEITILSAGNEKYHP